MAKTCWKQQLLSRVKIQHMKLIKTIAAQPTKFWVIGKFSFFVGKCCLKNYGLKTNLGKFSGKIDILSIQISSQKFTAVSCKTATSCPTYQWRGWGQGQLPPPKFLAVAKQSENPLLVRKLSSTEMQDLGIKPLFEEHLGEKSNF